jgi:intracellular sulfur oxidation DsrE/DsrF family protein
MESKMTRFHNVMLAAATCLFALFLAGQPATAQDGDAKALQGTPAGARTAHHLILQVNTNEAEAMNLALNNATNVAQYYGNLGQKVEIEVITFGPGLHMLRADTSPVKERIKAITERTSSISFKACGNTRENMAKVESREIPLLPQAAVVKSGVVRVMELQEQGWSYVRP